MSKVKTQFSGMFQTSKITACVLPCTWYSVRYSIKPELPRAVCADHSVRQWHEMLRTSKPDAACFLIRVITLKRNLKQVCMLEEDELLEKEPCVPNSIRVCVCVCVLSFEQKLIHLPSVY